VPPARLLVQDPGPAHSNQGNRQRRDLPGFCTSQLGTTEEVLGTEGTISRAETILYRPQRVNRREPAEIRGEAVDKGQNHLDGWHVHNFLDCVAGGMEPNCPFEIGFRVSVASRMAVEGYRRERVMRWDPVKEEIL
jgi:hypothetical protein